jgi:FkbM family methyltransferase
MSKCCVTNSNYGPLIVNALDTGLGMHVLKTGTHEQGIINLGLNIIHKQLELRPHGLNVLDVGANIGINTVAWGKALLIDNVITGTVTAFEPQERNYYALAGNIALNNLLNTRAIMAAVTTKSGKIKIPVMDHSLEGSFGGLSLIEHRESIGQKVSFEEENMMEVRAIALDDIGGRVDMIKIDVEGMEPQILDGAQKLIARERPVIIAEHIFCGHTEIRKRLEDYRAFILQDNVCGVPEEYTEMVDFVKSIITYPVP